MHLHDAPQNRQRLLRRVAGFFFAAGRHYGLPPSVGRGFAARGFFFAHQVGRHVGDAVYGVVVEGVMPRVFGEPVDVVVLARPAALAATAEVVGPDDLVDAVLAAAEDLLEQQAAGRRLPPIDVKEQAAVAGQNAVCLLQARAQKAQIVVEAVAVARLVQGGGAVAVAAEAGAVAGAVSVRFDALAALHFAGVEGRVYVDERHRCVRHFGEQRQVVAEKDLPLWSGQGRRCGWHLCGAHCGAGQASWRSSFLSSSLACAGLALPREAFMT